MEREVFYLRQKRCHEIGLRLVSDTKSQYDRSRGNLSPSVPIGLLPFLLSSEIRQPGFCPIGSGFPRKNTAHLPSSQAGIAGISERRCAPSHRSLLFLPNLQGNICEYTPILISFLANSIRPHPVSEAFPNGNRHTGNTSTAVSPPGYRLSAQKPGKFVWATHCPRR